MVIARDLKPTLLAAAILLGVPLGAVARASLQNPLASDPFCSQAALLSEIAGALSENNGTLETLAAHNSNITSTVTASGLAITIPGGKTLDVPATNDVYGVCKFAPIEERVTFENRTFPAQYVQAYSDVLRYRAAHPWPYGPADLNAPDAQVILVRYAPSYIVLYTADYVRHSDGRGGVILVSCSADEHYRVNPKTRQVLAFDSCVEPHKALLPTLEALPK
jgi:hypothetical protein